MHRGKRRDQHATSRPFIAGYGACGCDRGLEPTARLKLATAGVELGDVAFASAHDAPSKMEIMSIALTRALEAAQVSSFASLTYVGDSAVDAQSAQSLGFCFIGIDTSGWVSHMPHRFLDFSDHDAFIDRVLTLRETPR
jgi:phosphoglycolate phosphatase-like HAD superfamily hydrolase